MKNDHTKETFSFSSALKKDWYLILLILGSLALGLYLYPQLPDKLPSHWNIRGEVDGWTGKDFAVWFFPLLNLGLYFLFLLLPRLDPRRDNYPRFSGAYRLLRIFILLFLTLIYLLTLLYAVGYPIRIDLAVRLAVFTLLLIIGNYMGKFKHNYFVGVKTPWTLANEEVWRRTHRMAGPLWVGGGLAGILLSFFTQTWAAAASFAVIIILALGPIVYSYIVFQQVAGK